MEKWGIKALQHGGKWVNICSYADYATAHEDFLSLNARYEGRIIFILVRA